MIAQWSLPALWLVALSAHAAVDYQRDVRPLLAKRCYSCHGPDEQSRKASFRIDTRDGATGKGGTYPGIVPGDSAKSRAYLRITHPTKPMPPAGERLTEAETTLIKSWIDEGASYKQHWAFEKPATQALPAVSDAKWPKNAIDNFVLARLDKEGLKPSAEADRYTLARRASLDLIGLPPDAKELDAFMNDKSPKAYEAYVDRLLARPQFGERWARVWLDMARYADTQGYEKDNRRSIWPYRDWVIKAYNDNLTFDKFTLLQLAGDLLSKPTTDDLIATGFHRNTMTNTEGGTDDEEFRDIAVKDRVAVTGQVWMGLTWGCAQCHSHKYDPLSHKEFYQLYSFFNQSEDSDKSDDRPVLKLENASTLIMRELPAKQARMNRIHERGSFLSPGAEVSPLTPEAFHSWPASAPHNRLGLAQWLTSTENPLTARVQVNRYWARLFGRGLVESEEDFGTQGIQPTHQELLDWLAVDFMRTWDVKQLLRSIATSATYRQTSDVSPALYDRDRYNRLLARGARFRLDAEVVRDQALAAGGLLSAKMFGAPVMPWQPEGIWQVIYNGDKWSTSKDEDRYRRGIYTFIRRTSPYPTMTTFDAPTGEVCTMRRIRTNTPLQALAAMNDPVSMEAAQQLALRAMAGAKSETEIVNNLFRLSLARPANKNEVKRVLALHKESIAELKPASADPRKLLNYGKTLYAEDREITLLADARTTPAKWRYTEKEPQAKWNSAGFDDGGWKSGTGQFGFFPTKVADAKIGTEWKSESIWLRAEFDAPAEALEQVKLALRDNCAFDAYINGIPIAATNIERAGYYEFLVPADALAGIRPGRNVLAIHGQRLHETKTGQVIDGGLVASKKLDLGPKRKDDPNRAAWVVVANTILNLDEMVTRR